MKLKNRVKKLLGMKYTGCGKQLKSYESSSDGTKHILALRRDADALQAKYGDYNITVVVYDSNSSIEYITGPQVKELTGSRHDANITDEMMKQAVKNYEERNK